MSVETDSSTSGSVVFVRLLDEGTVVYRPVQAQLVGGGAYRLIGPADYDPDDEAWEFPPGSIVTCELRNFGGETVLVAVRLHS